MNTSANDLDEEEDEMDAQDDDGIDLNDRLGNIEERDEGDELVLSRVERYSNAKSTEMLRFDRARKLLRIFPMVIRHGQLDRQFDRITELQVEAPSWDPRYHSTESERFNLLRVTGLPKGFAAIYQFGLGIKRDYRGIVKEIERHSSCTVVRFVLSGEEGLDADGRTFRASLERFEEYRAIVDRDRGRGRIAVRRVIDAECHNVVADLFHLDRVEPKYGKHSVIRAITEEVATGHVTDAADRVALVDEVSLAAPTVAQEAPERFSQLREDIELVSLESLIDKFEVGLDGPHARDEDHWQRFFNTNRFALQQVFSMPIVVERQQAHVRAGDLDGRGARIADFLCVNVVTRTAIVVEIKTPGTALVDKTPYRGSGSAAVYAPHKHLSGAVSQVQSQMSSVPRDLVPRLQATPDLDMDPWNEARGAVIVGRVSSLTEEQRESFLRYRNGLAAVTVLGYDEVLERLRALLTMLKTAPQAIDGTPAAEPV